MQTRILAFSGGARQDALNEQLLGVAVRGAKGAGAEVTVVHLTDFALPLYDREWEDEHGLPEQARTLQALVLDHHGLLIATPEQNGGYTALLKNGIDWISRRDELEPDKGAVFAGKIAALISASAGSLGGLRSQLALHMVLNRLGVMVLPASFALGHAEQAFDVEGNMAATDDARVRNVGATLARVANLLARDGGEAVHSPSTSTRVLGAELPLPQV